MWVSRKKLEEIKCFAVATEESLKRLSESHRMLTVKVAGLESILDRLEREGNERTGYDRLIR